MLSMISTTIGWRSANASALLAVHLPSEDPQQDPGDQRKPPPPQPADEPPPVPEGDPPSDAPPERAQ